MKVEAFDEVDNKQEKHNQQHYQVIEKLDYLFKREDLIIEKLDQLFDLVKANEEHIKNLQVQKHNVNNGVWPARHVDRV